MAPETMENMVDDVACIESSHTRGGEWGLQDSTAAADQSQIYIGREFHSIEPHCYISADATCDGRA